MRTEDVLNQINNTLEDWDVSDDAMRSRPAPEPPVARGYTPTVAIMDEAGEWQQIGVTSIEIQVERPATDPEFERNWEQVREYFARLQAERIRQAEIVVQAFTHAVNTVIKPAIQQASRDLAQAREAFRHLPEAIGCNDCSKPPRPRDRPAWQSPYGPPQRRR
ncbi:MAG: hypothetical protein HOY75_43455 [Streptomyces sp.]|nr:hypothetical protein [Streptomyces sp.]